MDGLNRYAYCGNNPLIYFLVYSIGSYLSGVSSSGSWNPAAWSKDVWKSSLLWPLQAVNGMSWSSNGSVDVYYTSGGSGTIYDPLAIASEQMYQEISIELQQQLAEINSEYNSGLNSIRPDDDLYCDAGGSDIDFFQWLFDKGIWLDFPGCGPSIGGLMAQGFTEDQALSIYTEHGMATGIASLSVMSVYGSLIFLPTAAPAAGLGFSSFDQLKTYLGNAGVENSWHHIVEQCQIAKSGFDAFIINNTANIIRISDAIHNKISGYYNSIDFFTEGMRVRNWLAGQSFQAQYDFGIRILQRFGVIR